MSPLLIAVDLLQPSPPIEWSLHLMSLPLVLIRHRSMDLADQTGLGPLCMTARAQETPSAVTLASVAVRMNATWNGSFLAMLPATEEGPCSRESPSPRNLDFPSKSPSPHQKRFASQRSPSPPRKRFASRGSPSPKRMRFASDAQYQERFASRRSPSPPQKRFASKGSPSPKRMGFAPDAGPSSSRRPLSRDSRSPRPRSSRDFLSPKRGSPSPKRRRYESRDSVSPQQHHSSRACSREPSQERPHSRSSPTHPSSPSREDREADETSVPATVKAIVDFIM